MRIRKFNESIKDKMTPKSREEILKGFKENGVSERDVIGGIEPDEYDKIINFINNLKDQEVSGVITSEDKVLSEILLLLVENPERNKDYDMQFHRRIGFIEANKSKLD